MEIMLTHLIIDQASECNVLTLDTGLGEDACSMYLRRLIANQVVPEIDKDHSTSRQSNKQCNSKNTIHTNNNLNEDLWCAICILQHLPFYSPCFPSLS